MPPKAKAATRRTNRATFSDEFRDLIQRDGRSLYALGQAALVDPGIISRFMAGEREITTATMDRLAGALGVHVAAPTRAKGRPRKGTPAASMDPQSERF